MAGNKRERMLESILQTDDDVILNIPLKDLVSAIIWLSYEMRGLEDRMFKNYPYYPMDMSKDELERLEQKKEYYACRRDELVGLIIRYSDFDTQRIWDEVDKIFKKYEVLNE